MITFYVVKEQHGWAIRIGERMTMPFWSRDLAVREANCLADAIRCHGECTEVMVEGAEPNEPARGITGSNLVATLRGPLGRLRSDMSDV
jgi:hypothetical protein